MRSRPLLSYAALRRRADAYQAMVQARMVRLCREAGVDPKRLMQHPSSGRHYLDSSLPGREEARGKVRLALKLASRMGAAHLKLACLVVKGRTDLGVAKTRQAAATEPAEG